MLSAELPSKGIEKIGSDANNGFSQEFAKFPYWKQCCQFDSDRFCHISIFSCISSKNCLEPFSEKIF